MHQGLGEEDVMTLRRKILLIAVGLIVIVFAAVGAGWRQLSTDSSPVSVQKAVDQFQQAGKGNASGPPRPGVFARNLDPASHYSWQCSTCRRWASHHAH